MTLKDQRDDRRHGLLQLPMSAACSSWPSASVRDSEGQASSTGPCAASATLNALRASSCRAMSVTRMTDLRTPITMFQVNILNGRRALQKKGLLCAAFSPQRGKGVSALPMPYSANAQPLTVSGA